MEIGTVYWVTGLAGAGKTTIGTLLYNRLRAERPNVILLDGDVTRWAFNDANGYTKDDRRQAAYRNARVCKMISDQGIDVVCCTISMFESVREWNRKNIPLYREIFLDVPLRILKQRDKKGLYSKSIRGEARDVVGMDLTLELPSCPNVRIVNDGSISPEEVLAFIWEKFMYGNYEVSSKKLQGVDDRA
ncbi:MAG: adenylyl-sulfate kinase [Schwartzia sp.]|nr:adenylyl-sulfate kinase [Schwartzia sp. (in: firmicutes)]